MLEGRASAFRQGERDGEREREEEKEGGRETLRFLKNMEELR